jgi:hypothetical protein
MVVKVSSEGMPLGWPNVLCSNLACKNNSNSKSIKKHYQHVTCNKYCNPLAGSTKT